MSKARSLTVEVAVELLCAIGCDSDDVQVLPWRLTNMPALRSIQVNELREFQFLASPHTAIASAHEIAAKAVKLRYYAKGGNVDGTLFDLLIMRLREFRELSRVIAKPLKKKRTPAST